MKKAKVISKSASFVSRDFYNLRKKVFRFSALFLIVVVLAGGAWLYLRHQTEHRNYLAQLADEKKKNSLSETGLTTAVTKDIGNQNYQAAIDLINNQSGANSVADQSLLASVYSNEGNYNAALAVYSQINKSNNMTAAIAADAGSVARAANQNQLATSYYKQAVALLMKTPNLPFVHAYIEDYNNIIQQLQSKQT